MTACTSVASRSDRDIQADFEFFGITNCPSLLARRCWKRCRTGWAAQAAKTIFGPVRPLLAQSDGQWDWYGNRWSLQRSHSGCPDATTVSSSIRHRCEYGIAVAECWRSPDLSKRLPGCRFDNTANGSNTLFDQLHNEQLVRARTADAAVATESSSDSSHVLRSPRCLCRHAFLMGSQVANHSYLSSLQQKKKP